MEIIEEIKKKLKKDFSEYEELMNNAADEYDKEFYLGKSEYAKDFLDWIDYLINNYFNKEVKR